MEHRLISEPDSFPDEGAAFYSRYLQGDEDAFRDLMELYRENLIFFIHRYLHDLHEAEDVAEECFVALIVHPRRYRFKTGLKTYLFAMARNMAVDRFRRRSRQEPLGEETAEREAEYESFEDTLIKDERQRQLRKAMNDLPEDYRTVLHLVYFEGMSNAQTAKVMKKTTRQIENLLYRAKGALKKTAYGKDGWDE